MLTFPCFLHKVSVIWLQTSLKAGVKNIQTTAYNGINDPTFQESIQFDKFMSILNEAKQNAQRSLVVAFRAGVH